VAWALGGRTVLGNGATRPFSLGVQVLQRDSHQDTLRAHVVSASSAIAGRECPIRDTPQGEGPITQSLGGSMRRVRLLSLSVCALPATAQHVTQFKVSDDFLKVSAQDPVGDVRVTLDCAGPLHDPQDDCESYIGSAFVDRSTETSKRWCWSRRISASESHVLGAGLSPRCTTAAGVAGVTYHVGGAQHAHQRDANTLVCVEQEVQHLRTFAAGKYVQNLSPANLAECTLRLRTNLSTMDAEIILQRTIRIALMPISWHSHNANQRKGEVR
jgi:hypothetical protein